MNPHSPSPPPPSPSPPPASHHGRAAVAMFVRDAMADVKSRTQPPPGTSAAPALYSLLGDLDLIEVMVRGFGDMAVDHFGEALESLVRTRHDAVRKWVGEKVVEELNKLTGLLRSQAPMGGP